MPAFRAEVEERFRDLRDRIGARLEELEGGTKFKRTKWERPGGGGGEMSELRGEVFEKGGCNFSAVSGAQYPAVPGPGAPTRGARRRERRAPTPRGEPTHLEPRSSRESRSSPPESRSSSTRAARSS